MEKYNIELFLLINGLNGSAILDHVFVLITKYSPYLYAIILIILYLFYNRDKALYVFYSSLLGLLLNLIITIFYYHPRPFELGLGHTLINHTIETSFPSDHATLVFSISISTIIFGKKSIGFLLFILAVIIGFSRIYVGVHFPLDILGSFFVSIISVLIIYTLQSKLEKLNILLNKIADKLLRRIPFINYKG
ncbi:undecaprenyl-diphosphatase [Deferribacteraceae bacterium V6Fe1]|nr:undecaprenyl-diphosphatase [Deferribacteraceae bacterium V6Fe1]